MPIGGKVDYLIVLTVENSYHKDILKQIGVVSVFTSFLNLEIYDLLSK